MPKLIVKIQVYDEIIFVDKLFNHSIIHVHKDTERKAKKPRWIFKTQNGFSFFPYFLSVYFYHFQCFNNYYWNTENGRNTLIIKNLGFNAHFLLKDTDIKKVLC